MDFPHQVAEAVFLLQARHHGDERPITEKIPNTYNDPGVVKNVHMFCFLGDIDYLKKNWHWTYHNFVLTNQHGARLFGHCLRFALPDRPGVGALCLLSQDCLFNTMQHLLVHLWSAKKGVFLDSTRDGDDRWCIELGRLIHCVPCLVSRHVQSRMTISGKFQFGNRFPTIPTVHYRDDPEHPGNTKISFLFGIPTEDGTRFPPLDFRFSLLFSCLSVRNVITVFCSILAESKIVLVSSRAAVLAHVGEGLRALLWPFTWEHVYIPLLPENMLDFLNAPTPFIMGMVRDESRLRQLDDDAVLVDLDRDDVRRGHQYVSVSLPPQLEQQLEEDLWSVARTDIATANEAIPEAVREVDGDVDACRLFREHPVTVYNNSVQFAFYTVWRRLFTGWSFGDINQINQYIDKWVPASFQSFYHVFCSTLSFDQFHRAWLTDDKGSSIMVELNPKKKKII